LLNGRSPSHAYEGIRVEPELLAETWLKSKNPASEAVRREREEEWR
jgi:hypothetical protein